MTRCLLIICLFSLASAPATSDTTKNLLDTIPSNSPLSWVHIAASTEDMESAIRVADRAMGTVAASTRSKIELVRLSDRDPFGESLSNRLAWLITYTSVTIVRAGSVDTTSIDVTVAVAAEDTTLLEAFTQAADRWLAPFGTQRDPETILEHWNIQPLGSAVLESTVTEVMAELWHHFGQNPGEAGQIILRPRIVDPEFPARWENGHLIPVYDSAARWIAHELGIFTGEMTPPPVVRPDGTIEPSGEEESPYFTGRLVLIDDETCSYMMAVSVD